MTEAEQVQVSRRLHLCAHYNFTEGVRFAAALLDDVINDPRTTDKLALPHAAAVLRAKVAEREAASREGREEA
jgi:dsDNA-specific endonuclease/ATPase MutS2